MIASYTSSGCRSSLIFSTLFSLWFSLRIRTPYRTSHKVQTAFGFVHARPATRPGVFARGHRPGTRFAPYAFVSSPKEGVERDAPLPHVLLHFPGAPVHQRCYLHDTEALLPTQHGRARPLRCLVPADPRHPRTVVPQKTPLRLDLADLAAEVRRAAVELRPVTRDLLLDREPRREDLERQRILFHGLLAETHRLLEEKPGIQRKDLRLVGDAREHVQKDHPLGIPEGDREREIFAINAHGPPQNILRSTVFQTLRHPREPFAPDYLVFSLCPQSFSHQSPPPEESKFSDVRKVKRGRRYIERARDSRKTQVSRQSRVWSANPRTGYYIDIAHT